MKKFFMKHSHILSVFALVFTTLAANRSCGTILHESKLPDTAKKLRKF